MTVTPAPVIPVMPDAPNRFTDNGEAYTDKANDTMAALPNTVAGIQDASEVTQANAEAAEAAAASAEAAAGQATLAAAAAVTTSAYFDEIPTSLAISAGAKALTGIVGTLAMANTEDWYLVSKANPGNRMHGTISALNLGAGTATLTVAADGFAGAGTYTDWQLTPASLMPLLTGLAADLLLGTSQIAALTPDAIYDALAEVTLTDAATIAVDMSTFLNAKVTLAGNRTLGNPTNAKPAQTGRIRVIQDATGSRTLAFAANWKRQGGAPTLTTTAAHFDVIEYDVITSTLILYDLIRDPS